MSKRRMLTPAEYGASLPDPKGARWVRYLCEGRRIPGARRTGEGFRASWAIPEGAKLTVVPKGRPKGSRNK